MGVHATGLTATFLALAILLQPLSPIANSVPGGVAYSGDTRSVPIFAVMQEGGRQPTQVVLSGFLYSPRIVFTAGIQERLFDQAKGGIYVGKPGSKTTDMSGRVRVIKAFYPNSGDAELNDFVVFVLERELAKIEPFPLLQMGQEANVREASVRGYGEYQDRCGPGAQGPCPEKPTSEISRQINVNLISLSQAESLVGYERPQLMGQIFLQNATSAQDGVVCPGDAGSPVIGNLGGTGVYLGAASRAMNAKICGAVGVEKVERDKPKVSTSFDGIAGITHIAPVYRFSSVINEARNYAAQTPEPTATPTPTSTQEPKEVKIENSTWGAEPKVSAEQHEMIKVIYPGNLREMSDEVTGFRIYNSKGKVRSLQAGQVLLKDVKCEFDKNTTCYLNKYRYLAFSHNEGITEKNPTFKGNKGVEISVAAYNSKGEGVKSNRLPFPICPRYIFIGMRGSGEKFSEGPIGATNKVVYELLRGHDKVNFNILEDGVPRYKAAPVLSPPVLTQTGLKLQTALSAYYLTQVVSESTEKLAFRFAEINQVCNEDKKDSERTKFFLSGYSQGAYGVNDLINIWERGFRTDVPKVIAGVFLIANPAEPNTGIITAIDSISEKKVAQATSLALCGVSATLSNTLLRALEGGSRWTRKWREAQIKILDLLRGPQKNDTDLSKELEKTQKIYEKVVAEARKNANLEDFPLCQLMFMNIILEAYDRKLETPRYVNVDAHFAPGDIVADALPLLRDAALEAVEAAAKVPKKGPAGAARGAVFRVGVSVGRGIYIHTAYKNECSWAQDAIAKVVGPPTSQIHAQGSFVEQYLPESHPCRKS